MFKVTKITDNTSEILKRIKYVKNQDNGVIILTDNQEEAQGIIGSDNDTIYAIQGRGLDEQYEVVTIEEITVEDYLLSITSQLQETKDNQLTIMSAIADLYESQNSEVIQMIELYVKLVKAGRKTIDKVPMKYREEVQARLDEQNNNNISNKNIKEISYKSYWF